MFNIAILQQKGVELLFDLLPERRTLAEIHQALADCEESQKCVQSPIVLTSPRPDGPCTQPRLFQRLADDPNTQTPYAKELPTARQKYGVSLVKRSADIITAQQLHESSEQAKVERAKQAREAERERQAEEEAKRQAEVDQRAHELAEQRRRMREEAELYAQSKLGIVESDEEDKPKVKKGAGKKRKSKAKREDGGESTAEEDEKPKPKKSKKVRDSPSRWIQDHF